MNQGKRLVRNTVLVVWGCMALYVGINRIHASTDESTSPWVRNALSLGLMKAERREERVPMDLATARDFSEVSVYGRMNVEITGGAEFSVEYRSSAGGVVPLGARMENGRLSIAGEEREEGGEAGALRIQAPTLKAIYANVPSLTVRGMSSPEIAMYANEIGDLRLLQNQVERWTIFSGGIEVRMDDATFAAGSISTRGEVIVRRDQ